MKNSKNFVDACLACAIECEVCASNGINLNDKNHLKCIALCRDCADICALCARFAARGSSFCDALCKLCADLCIACAAECEKLSAHDFYKKNAEACRKCAAECSKM